MRYKVLIVSFLVFLPIWLGVNLLSANLEDFWYLKEITENPSILNAQADYTISQLNLSKLQAEKNLESKLESLDIDAGSAIVVDIDSGKTIFEKNSFQTRPIASLTKLMTALVVYDLNGTYDPNQLIKIDKKAIEQDGECGLKTGSSVSVQNLLHIMLVESCNDAAYAITEPIGQDAFIDLMDAKAKELGLNNTYYLNSTGLDPDDPLQARNISTAYDLSKLVKYILNNYPQIFDTTTDIKYNTNELLTDYPEIIGGKTGWTPLAGGCLIVITQEPSKKEYISIILGSKDRFSDMSQILNVLK
jgi:serine-type D-Ala-D-Ala carboxypeptidase (penicillin-binding protein 5/6)